MALFYVTFDLGKRKGHRRLLRHLEQYQARRVLRSIWVLEEVCTPEELRDDLSLWVDEDCRLLVIESAKAAWSGPILFNPRELQGFRHPVGPLSSRTPSPSEDTK